VCCVRVCFNCFLQGCVIFCFSFLLQDKFKSQLPSAFGLSSIYRFSVDCVFCDFEAAQASRLITIVVELKRKSLSRNVLPSSRRKVPCLSAEHHF
jgi:hypothetical protein